MFEKISLTVRRHFKDMIFEPENARDGSSLHSFE
jgi:hypothetical protein